MKLTEAFLLTALPFVVASDSLELEKGAEKILDSCNQRVFNIESFVRPTHGWVESSGVSWDGRLHVPSTVAVKSDPLGVGIQMG